MSGSGRWSHMDETIRISSSHVGVSRYLRLIRYRGLVLGNVRVH